MLDGGASSDNGMSGQHGLGHHRAGTDPAADTHHSRTDDGDPFSNDHAGMQNQRTDQSGRRVDLAPLTYQNLIAPPGETGRPLLPDSPGQNAFAQGQETPLLAQIDGIQSKGQVVVQGAFGGQCGT